MSYNGANKTLTASVFKPLIIKNDYLAYEITFDLMHFTIEYNLENTLSKDYIRKSYFAGTSAFNDISVQGDKKIEKRRKEVYEGSPNRFYKNLINNTLKESKYRVFRNSYETNPERCFAIKDTLSMKMLTVIRDESFSLDQRIVILDSKKIPPRPSRVSVLDNKKRQSDIVFHIDKILIDTFGNISSPDKVFYSGEWSDYKLGRMLPLEYDPDK